MSNTKEEISSTLSNEEFIQQQVSPSNQFPDKSLQTLNGMADHGASLTQAEENLMMSDSEESLMSTIPAMDSMDIDLKEEKLDWETTLQDKENQFLQANALAKKYASLLKSSEEHAHELEIKLKELEISYMNLEKDRHRDRSKHSHEILEMKNRLESSDKEQQQLACKLEKKEKLTQSLQKKQTEMFHLNFELCESNEKLNARIKLLERNKKELEQQKLNLVSACEELYTANAELIDRLDSLAGQEEQRNRTSECLCSDNSSTLAMTSQLELMEARLKEALQERDALVIRNAELLAGLPSDSPSLNRGQCLDFDCDNGLPTPPPDQLASLPSTGSSVELSLTESDLVHDIPVNEEIFVTGDPGTPAKVTVESVPEDGPYDFPKERDSISLRESGTEQDSHEDEMSGLPESDTNLSLERIVDCHEHCNQNALAHSATMLSTVDAIQSVAIESAYVVQSMKEDVKLTLKSYNEYRSIAQTLAQNLRETSIKCEAANSEVKDLTRELNLSLHREKLLLEKQSELSNEVLQVQEDMKNLTEFFAEVKNSISRSKSLFSSQETRNEQMYRSKVLVENSNELLLTKLNTLEELLAEFKNEKTSVMAILEQITDSSAGTECVLSLAQHAFTRHRKALEDLEACQAEKNAFAEEKNCIQQRFDEAMEIGDLERQALMQNIARLEKEKNTEKELMKNSELRLKEELEDSKTKLSEAAQEQKELQENCRLVQENLVKELDHARSGLEQAKVEIEMKVLALQGDINRLNTEKNEALLRSDEMNKKMEVLLDVERKEKKKALEINAFFRDEIRNLLKEVKSIQANVQADRNYVTILPKDEDLKRTNIENIPSIHGKEGNDSLQDLSQKRDGINSPRSEIRECEILDDHKKSVKNTDSPNTLKSDEENHEKVDLKCDSTDIKSSTISHNLDMKQDEEKISHNSEETNSIEYERLQCISTNESESDLSVVKELQVWVQKFVALFKEKEEDMKGLSEKLQRAIAAGEDFSGRLRQSEMDLFAMGESVKSLQDKVQLLEDEKNAQVTERSSFEASLQLKNLECIHLTRDLEEKASLVEELQGLLQEVKSNEQRSAQLLDMKTEAMESLAKTLQDVEQMRDLLVDDVARKDKKLAKVSKLLRQYRENLRLLKVRFMVMAKKVSNLERLNKTKECDTAAHLQMRKRDSPLTDNFAAPNNKNVTNIPSQSDSAEVHTAGLLLDRTSSTKKSYGTNVPQNTAVASVNEPLAAFHLVVKDTKMAEVATNVLQRDLSNVSVKLNHPTSLKNDHDNSSDDSSVIPDSQFTEPPKIESLRNISNLMHVKRPTPATSDSLHKRYKRSNSKEEASRQLPAKPLTLQHDNSAAPHEVSWRRSRPSVEAHHATPVISNSRHLPSRRPQPSGTTDRSSDTRSPFRLSAFRNSSRGRATDYAENLDSEGANRPNHNSRAKTNRLSKQYFENNPLEETYVPVVDSIGSDASAQDRNACLVGDGSVGTVTHRR
ncbi:sporulation-specific protein 15 isoform X2 [Hyalella azteca]|uniref:Sporulation-specific protein 15 isoform X2 n=1 Tax=Hyalella azteca TaxID=294128 RepID=A0A8B7PLR7_HYAAZ|nr:sporulation-specific protein 15 isoform X2 [Hyalella azteca]